MASEDNFLNSDPFNYDTELEWLLALGSFSFEDYRGLYQDGKISKEDFELCKEYFEIT
jgi:hypothetical protein